MAVFYFTYGSEGQPFVGGWTEVAAESKAVAVAAFRVFHPDKVAGLVNCSSIYDEERFKQTKMYQNGNFGIRCHEIIGIARTPL